MAWKKVPRDDHGYWWAHVMAVPAIRDSLEYRRLRRVWADPTGTGDWYYDRKSEVHLTVTTFENFAVLPAGSWLPQILERVAPNIIQGSIAGCQWSYEFDTGVGGRLPDVVVNFQDAAGFGLLLVESKAPGKPLGDKDLDPSYYLDLPHFTCYKRRFLLYLLGEAQVASEAKRVIDSGSAAIRHGFASWQAFAAMQVMCADCLDIPPAYRNFIAGAIQYQWLVHGVRPANLRPTYLEHEAAGWEVPASGKLSGGQTNDDRRAKDWCLPS